MKTYPYAILGMAVTWMFLRGVLGLATFVEGLVLSALAVFMTRRILKPEVRETFPKVLRRIPRFLLYVGFFIKGVVVGNLDVAYRTLHPRLPIHPGILAVDVSGRSPLEVTMIANTITLTPGTLTLDVDMKKGILFVHTINARELEEVREDLKEVERYVARVMR